ncbi:hypothetical protein [Agreia sp. COWG]|nr:hypothetical protein [Agreia sp. COWG]
MRPPRAPVGWRYSVLDVVYVLAIVAVFGVVALVAWGVEKL